MDYSSVIHAFGKILTSYRFTDGGTVPEEFAVKRFLKKMEVPDESNAKARKQKCFQDWVAFDESLSLPGLLPGNWYKARSLIHQWFRDFRQGDLTFTSGSEARSTKGLNSIESKLCRSAWECSPDAFELWARTAYDSMPLKRATRMRFSAIMLHRKDIVRRFQKESWKMFKGQRNAKFLCFRRTLSHVTTVRPASRFSTVRKNNEKDRPIDIQPVCNMLVQRQIGNGIRNVLLRHGLDLDSLAAQHRLMIRNRGLATIDLENASDSVQLDLVKFLFPSAFFSLIEKARTFYTEGLDGNYYVTKKVSAMGNGFTFELMTVILYALGLQLDSQCSCFGDDIIIRESVADSLIRDLSAVGFKVNVAKTFIGGPFRESCGANYHDDFGYLESYDFEYPITIHDCVVLNNKAFALGLKYRQFRKLSKLLLRVVPTALHGPPQALHDEGPGNAGQGYAQDVNLSTTFWSNTKRRAEVVNDPHLSRKLEALCYEPKTFYKVYGFRYAPDLASRMRDVLVNRRHWAKYLMYLHSVRRCDDTITGRGSWHKVAYLTDGKVLLRIKSLKDPGLLCVHG